MTQMCELGKKNTPTCNCTFDIYCRAVLLSESRLPPASCGHCGTLYSPEMPQCLCAGA